MKKNVLGLAFGLILAALHLVWVVLVAVGLAKPLMDFCLGLHSINLAYTLEPVDLTKSAILVVLTFVVGYVAGWVLAALLGMTQGKKK